MPWPWPCGFGAFLPYGLLSFCSLSIFFCEGHVRSKCPSVADVASESLFSVCGFQGAWGWCWTQLALNAGPLSWLAYARIFLIANEKLSDSGQNIFVQLNSLAWSLCSLKIGFLSMPERGQHVEARYRRNPSRT